MRYLRLIGTVAVACLMGTAAAQTPQATEKEHASAQSLYEGQLVNFGVKGGFTSSLFLVSDLTINDVRIDEVQNFYRIGYFGSVFMRINFKRHFVQPEISYAINRSGISFLMPATSENKAQTAGIETTIRNFDIPVIYGYNLVKEHPCSMAIFGGPKLRYIWGGESHVEFRNFPQEGLSERLRPFNVSLTLGVAVTISPIFFDCRYDISLHNISKEVTYQPKDSPEPLATHSVRFRHHDNVLSFSLGVFF